ncbi:IclR family transcriptional regulator [Citricoccus nitrophenolicus]|uniref:IclR family transcriptional regulator n=1 Tax=Citricoccus nitrophenolicus TaxID=863575 RepID=UPI0039B433D7
MTEDIPLAEQPTAAGRVLSVLDVFDSDHLELTLSEIGRRSGLTLSTTHRLVGELHAWGALERLPDGRYTVGMRVLELGTLEPQMLQLRDVAPAYLADLQAAVNANVHLSVRAGHDVVYLESLQRASGAPVLSRLGGRWPLHTTATGLVLLAFAPPEVVDEVLASPLRRFTEHTVTDPDVLRRLLAEVRRTGRSELHESITLGAFAVGVPVRGPLDRPIAALSLTLKQGGPTTAHHVLPALHATARALSRAVGSPSAPDSPPGHAPGRAGRLGSVGPGHLA